MSTVLRLGPGDHGRPMTYGEFIAGDYLEGYRYELIEGRLYVSPQPNFPHDGNLTYLHRVLDQYRAANPHVINYVSTHARVFLPEEVSDDVTAPEPDFAAYHDLPLEQIWTIDWREVSPMLVIEVLGGEDDDKDLVRNVDLYFRVPSIQEYWVWDICENPGQPRLIVRRRQKRTWKILEFNADAVYTTDLLPGFNLPVTPSPL